MLRRLSISEITMIHWIDLAKLSVAAVLYSFLIFALLEISMFWFYNKVERRNKAFLIAFLLIFISVFLLLFGISRAKECHNYSILLFALSILIPGTLIAFVAIFRELQN